MVRKADPGIRGRLLGAATAIFNEKAFSSARMHDIALRAGVAVGTVYLYFPSKEALVHGIVDDFVERMTAHIAPHFDEPDFERMIAAVIHEALAFALREEAVVKLIDLRNGLGGYPAVRMTAEQQQIEAITVLLRRQMAAGVVYPYDPELLTDVLRGLIEWVYKTVLLWKVRDMATYEALIVQFIQRALLVTSPTGAR